MKHADGFFQNRQGDRIFCQNWVPDGEPKAVLILVHGLAEHSGRYLDFAEYFCGEGFAVYALDHPGHGKSAGVRCHIDAFDHFTSTLRQYVETAKQAHKNVPRVLVGHSMGGLIAASYLIGRQRDFVAAVLSGPAIQAPQPPSAFAKFVLRILARMFPRLGVLQLDSNGVSRDPDVVRRYDEDPLVFRGKVTVRLAAEVFKAMDCVAAQAGAITLPLLIMHGGSDCLASVDGSRQLHRSIRSAEKKITIYEGLYHEIFNEPERMAVLTDMKSWLEGVIPVKGGQ